MKNRQWLLATIGEDAPALAAAHGLALELDTFCVAGNMDEDFPRWDAEARAMMAVAPAGVLHAPFAELFPCAMDPKARALAMERLRRAADIALGYGIRRMVVHTGNIPRVYWPVWFETESAAFWQQLLDGLPADFELLIENVLDDDPASVARMLENVGDARAAACLDVGHAHVASSHPVLEWTQTLAPWLRHVHLHNNHGQQDEHNPPDRGTLDVPAFLTALDALAPQATITLECPDARAAVDWLERFTGGQN